MNVLPKMCWLLLVGQLMVGCVSLGVVAIRAIRFGWKGHYAVYGYQIVLVGLYVYGMLSSPPLLGDMVGAVYWSAVVGSTALNLLPLEVEGLQILGIRPHRRLLSTAIIISSFSLVLGAGMYYGLSEASRALPDGGRLPDDGGGSMDRLEQVKVGMSEARCASYWSNPSQSDSASEATGDCIVPRRNILVKVKYPDGDDVNDSVKMA